MNPPAPTWIRFGTPEYRRVGFALFMAGFATFSLLYCVQPLLPVFADEFKVSPAESSLALSLSTGTLAFAIAAAGAFSQALGRRGLMFVSLVLAAACQLVAGLVSSWHALLIARTLEGVMLAGVPAVAMAYLSEEIDPRHLGKTMGLYVAGTAFGGMAGRVGMGLLTEFLAWRPAMLVVAAYCLVAAVGFRFLVPPSRNFVRRPGFDPAFHLRAFGKHLASGPLRRIYAVCFISMSIFVAVFNYMTFRLTDAPYLLSQGAVSLIFLAYGFGIASSSIGGALSDKFGGRPLLLAAFTIILAGILVSLHGSLATIFLSVCLVAVGHFIGHAVSSGSVGPAAGQDKGHAASLYFVFYYLGSSISGTAGGWFWHHGGWPSVAGFTGTLALGGLVFAFFLRPRPTGQPAPD